MKKPGITFFTVVMNRLHHLKQTLPENMEHNNEPSTRFLLLDYNSTDGLKDYILANFSKELQTGKLSYHRYAHARYFSHSHSRNLAVRHVNTTHVCNVDADNFTGKNFDTWLADLFTLNLGSVISAISNSHKIYGVFGRMAISLDQFNAVGGYDESFEGYGFEDYDLVSRLQENGAKKILIDDTRFLKALSHDNEDRLAMEWTKDQFHSVYRHQVNESMQAILYLFKDGTFHYGLLNEDFKAGEHYRYYLAGNSWQEGTWTRSDEHFHLQFRQFEVQFEQNDMYLTGHHHNLKKEQDPEGLQEAMLFHTNMANCCRYLLNKQRLKVRVNENGFGCGTTESILYHY